MEEERKKITDAILAKMEWWKWKNDEPYFGLAHSLKENNDKEFFIRICRKHLTTLERIEHLKSLMLNNSMCAKLNEVQMKWLNEYSNDIPPKQKQEQAAETKLPEKLNTDEAKKYIQKAVNIGVVEYTESGVKWNGTKQLLAYFAEKMSIRLNLSNKFYNTGNKAVCWKPFEKMFGVCNLREAKQNWLRLNTRFEPTGFENINKIFD